MNIESRTESELVLTYDVDPLIGLDELRALDNMMERALRVLGYAARHKHYHGRFRKQGIIAQMQHAAEHVRHRDRIDHETGELELVHAWVRMAFEHELKANRDTEPHELSPETLVSVKPLGASHG